MDYTVGSLSDLITGTNTPDKQKVKTKQVNLKNSASVMNESSEFKVKKAKETTPLKQKEKGKKVKQSSPMKTPEKETNRKHKLDDNSEDSPKPKKLKKNKNAERRIALKEKKAKEEEDPEVRKRTVFVGNLPITCDTKKIKTLFMKYGNVESVRIRGIPVADPKTPQKVAVIKKKFHPERKSFHGYVKFEQREDAIKAVEANGLIYKDHHLRVQLCVDENKPDESKAIFVGNLSFFAEEEDLWKIFEPCGPIESVRIVRDKKTRIGKGFGYVNFKNSDSVTLALEMENVKLKDRELRINLCNLGIAKKNKKMGKNKKIKKPGKPKQLKQKKVTNGFGNVNGNHETEDTSVQDEEKIENQELGEINNENDGNVNKSVGKKMKSFQGITLSDKKKKKKINKGLIEKRKIIKKVAPRDN